MSDFNNSNFSSAAQEVYLMVKANDMWKRMRRKIIGTQYGGDHPEFTELCSRLNIPLPKEA